MRLLIVWLFIFLAGLAKSQKVVTISNSDKVVNLAYEAEFIEDEKGALTIEEILHGKHTDSFQRVGKKIASFGLTHSFFWLRTKITNATSEHLRIQLTTRALTDVQVFETVNNTIVSQYHSGNWQPFYQKEEMKNLYFTFPLSAAPNTTATIYLRVMHNRSTQFPLRAGTLTAFYYEETERTLFEGLYYGFMIVMILYNLFIYFSLRDASYLYYVIYIFVMTFYNAAMNGYTFQYFYPSFPWLNQYEDILAALVGMAAILFANKFLNTRQTSPIFHKIFLALMACYIVTIGIVASGNFLLGTLVVETISVVLVVTLFIAAYKILKKGYKPAKYFLIAWSTLLISVIIFILRDFDILPYHALTEGSLKIGSAVEALLLSIALADRISVYKKEKRQAQLAALHSLQENEKLIKEQNVILEKNVEERTIELKNTNKELLVAMTNLNDTQAQLVQKEKMASLGELTAGIAHEIQNPLNFVNNFSEVSIELTDELIEESASGNSTEVKEIAGNLKENLQKIIHHGKRADSIVKSMLQHSRATGEKKQLTDINALAEEYLRLSYHGLRAKDKSFQAHYQMELDPALKKINVVPQDLGRVFLNLFNNSFYSVTEKKRLTNGRFEPKVELQTRQMADRVEIRVKDNGMGIPGKIKEKIFQPFFTTKPTGEGTGLGLSLSYDIVTKEHGGEMWVETEEGEYAQFIIYLPSVNKNEPVE